MIARAEPLSQAHPTSQDSHVAGKSPPGLAIAVAAVAGLAVIATLALWFHYGTQVFFETIRVGLAACL